MRFFHNSVRAQRKRVEPTVAGPGHNGGPPLAASPENPSTPLSNPDAWLIDWASMGAGGTFGPPVTEQTAMAVSAVFRCAALIAGLIAGIPLNIYRDDPKQGRVEVTDHKYADFLTMAPYPGRAMTAFTWREQWSLNTTLWGNHYSVIRYNGAGRILGFEPAIPWQTQVVRIASGQNAYRFSWANGAVEDVPQDDVLHIPGLGFDGIKGASRIRQFGRNAVSLAKLFEEQVGRFHENAARPSGALKLGGKVTPEGLAKQIAYFREKYAGRMNAGEPLILEGGDEFTPFAISAEDLQTLESRRFQVADICRFFGVPPHLVGEAAGTSAWGSGIEQLTIGFLVFTLDAELKRIEAELNLKLFAGSGHYAHFDRDALRALDVKTDAEAAAAEIGSGQITINERRKVKHRGAVDGGDEPLINSTMIPLKRALNPPQPAPAPRPQPPGGPGRNQDSTDEA